jgi:hypothetical protein
MQKGNNAAALRQPYLRVVHLEMSSPSSSGSGGLNPFGVQFTPEEEEEFGEMARSEDFYERFAKSVAPSIFGSLGSFRSYRCATLLADYLVKISRRLLLACYLVAQRKSSQTECD